MLYFQSLGLKVEVPDYSTLPAEDVITADVDDTVRENNDGNGENKPNDNMMNDGKIMDCDGAGNTEKANDDEHQLATSKDTREHTDTEMEVDRGMDITEGEEKAWKATEQVDNKEDRDDKTGIANNSSCEEIGRKASEFSEEGKGGISGETRLKEEFDIVDESKDVISQKIDSSMKLIKEEAEVNIEDVKLSTDCTRNVIDEVKCENSGHDSKVIDQRVVDGETKDAVGSGEGKTSETDTKEVTPTDNEKGSNEECMEVENISEDSSSIQEALITAHALLNSLSPMKSESFPGCPSGPSPKFNLELETGSVLEKKQEIGKETGSQERKSDDSGKDSFAKVSPSEDGNETKPDSQRSSGLFTKSSSYGFTVSDMLSDDIEHDSKHSIENPLHKEKPDNLDVEMNKDEKQCGVSAPDKSDLVNVETKNISCDSPIVIDSSSSSQGSHSRLQTVPLSSEVSTTSLTLTGSSITTSTGMLDGSVTLTQSEIKPPVLNVVPPSKGSGSVSDHGYSRAFSEMPCNESTPKKSSLPQSAAGRSPGSYIVMQDSQSSASYIEVPLDIDDRSPSSRKAQKRKRPSLATEEILNYGKRRSARVCIKVINQHFVKFQNKFL